MRRKPLNPDSAQAEGVDYLLREFKALRTAVGTGGGAAATGTDGPIEPTLFVAAYDTRPEIQAGADFVCDGTADQEEINAAITLASALQTSGDGGAVVQLSAGHFWTSDKISATAVTNGSVTIRGMGLGVTIVETVAAPSTARDGVIENYSNYGVVSDLTVGLWNTNYYAAVSIDPGSATHGRIERVSAWTIPSPVYASLNGSFVVGGYTTVRDVLVESGSLGDGIVLAASGTQVIVDGANILSATTDGAADGYGISVPWTNSIGQRIVNCFIDGCDTYGIHTTGDNALIIGNDASDGIYIDTTADGTRIGGNIGAITDNGTNTVYLDNTGVLSSVVKHDNFNQAGALSVGSGTIRYYTQTDRTITGCYAMVSGAPSGSAAIFDVNIDGTTAYTTQGNRPTVAAAGYLSTVTVPDVTAWDTGSYLTIDVDAANSATDLILVVEYTEA